MAREKRHTLTRKEEKKIMAHIIDHAEVGMDYWIDPIISEGTDFEQWEDKVLSKLTKQPIHEVLGYLQDQGLLILSQGVECDEYKVVLTTKGRMYLETAARESWDFWRRSVFIPFGVALITSAIANLLWP